VTPQNSPVIELVVEISVTEPHVEIPVIEPVEI
jgi:hypothetical protein